ncbi:3-oxoacyl-ACP reductase FabG [Portibacter lacus]|uniref:3-oxoacyl-[acyl-carrier-protein] reductase FabG n=1 Tax=Portibacter lacus TaxID=1099794 RepID=A0AA37WIN6_9BACT|nr:3-oxoacyl-ACP reductase FabG [Portibacter lacus]GLR20010.1 beta-ketoacyl-ACP reductase [Portibacter lacus]
MEFKNKVVIITGGGNGIGKATSLRFADAGATIVIYDLDIESADLVKQSIESKGGSATTYIVNTSKIGEVETATKAVFEKYGRIDVLINNAGITRDSSLKKMTPEQWQMVIDVNLTGVFNCTKVISPFMAEAGYGRIINASSVVAHNGNFGQTNYVAAKSGVIGMTKVWAREFGRKGITVNAIAPGYINTEMVQTVPEEYINSIKAKTPLQRLGEVEDIANAYYFLASDQASFITGTTLCVDGGLVI